MEKANRRLHPLIHTIPSAASTQDMGVRSKQQK